MIGKYATIWQHKFDNGKLLNPVGKGIKKGNSKRQKTDHIQKRKLGTILAVITADYWYNVPDI